MSEAPVSHPLSQAVYEGVLEIPPWKTLLKSLEAYMQVPSATLVLRRPRVADPGFTVYLYSDSHRDALTDFQTKAHIDSPFAELPENEVFTLYDRVTQSELKTLAFNDYLKAYDISDLIGFDVYDKQSRIRVRLRLVRLGDSPAFSARDRALLDAVVPLMKKALSLYGAYARRSFMEEFYDQLLGDLDIASVIVTGDLKVISANSQAKQIFSSKDGLYLRHNSLRCVRSSEQAKLETVCGELLSGDQEAAQATGTSSLSIGRSDAGGSWDVQVRTVRNQNVVFANEGSELALLLQDPVRDCTPSDSRLIEVFGVTPAEAKLIAQLVDGLTLTAAAEALAISRNTARAQLSSVFTKTGVNRQAQLVKLVSDAFVTHWR